MLTILILNRTVSKHTEKLLKQLRSCDTVVKMSFIKEESEDMKTEETFRVKHEDTEEQTKMGLLKRRVKT